MSAIDVALRLGRVSNLPTVWSNALAGVVLVGGTLSGTWVTVACALSAFYVGGMWLNDAFDAEIDRRIAPDRPIPAGEIGRRAVFGGGFGMLALGIAISAVLGTSAFVVGLLLAAAVILYDAVHKKTDAAPVIMGLTRGLCYALAAVAAGGALAEIGLPVIGLFAHIVGLTYAARQEAYDRIERAWPLAVLVAAPAILFWLALGSGLALSFLVLFVAAILVALRFLVRRAPGDVRRAVILMIAAVSLYDATVISAAGSPIIAMIAVVCFGATLSLQRVSSGT